MKKIIELKKLLKDQDETSGGVDRVCDYTSTHYLSDTISELADANVDIYTCDLLNYLENHIGDVEDYVRDNMTDASSFDLCDAIRGAQYMDYYMEYQNAAKDLTLYFIYHNYFNDDDVILNDLDDMITEVADEFTNNEILPDEDEFTDALNEKKADRVRDLLSIYIKDESGQADAAKYETMEDEDLVKIYDRAHEIETNHSGEDLDAMIVTCFAYYVKEAC